MELSFSSKDLEFRDEVRDFLANEYPKHVKEKIENGEPLTREVELLILIQVGIKILLDLIFLVIVSNQ